MPRRSKFFSSLFVSLACVLNELELPLGAAEVQTLARLVLEFIHSFPSLIVRYREVNYAALSRFLVVLHRRGLLLDRLLEQVVPEALLTAIMPLQQQLDDALAQLEMEVDESEDEEDSDEDEKSGGLEEVQRQRAMWQRLQRSARVREDAESREDLEESRQAWYQYGYLWHNLLGVDADERWVDLAKIAIPQNKQKMIRGRPIVEICVAKPLIVASTAAALSRFGHRTASQKRMEASANWIGDSDAQLQAWVREKMELRTSSETEQLVAGMRRALFDRLLQVCRCVTFVVLLLRWFDVPECPISERCRVPPPSVSVSLVLASRVVAAPPCAFSLPLPPDRTFFGS